MSAAGDKVKLNPVYRQPGNDNPYYQGNEGTTRVGTASGFAPMANTNDILVQNVLARMGIGQPQGATPYASPYAGRASSTADALSGMTGREASMSPYGSDRSSMVSSEATAGLQYPAQSQMLQAEPDRMNNLLKILMQAYGMSTGIYGEQQKEDDARRNIKSGAIRSAFS